ncbi:hypothetical protein [Geothrix sp. 21YS21S-2]|uniref:hypothetical protein n=1 Tax=Geothrix sp. 21YS21S-2 TaxID=3068893 RepID=UPI0027BAD891|nr:hypothetical protein [Geothrix sp. 21YS21S-2]
MIPDATTDLSFRPPAFLGAAIVALMLSCGGGGGSSAPNPVFPSVPAPSNVTVAYSPSNYQVTVSWTPPAATVDGYDLEGCLQGQAFTKLNTTLIPAAYTSALLTTSTVPRELDTFTFRMRSFAGTTYGGYSNTASFTTPLNPLSYVFATASPDKLEIAVTLGQSSYMATGIILERATVDANGEAIGAWTRLAELPAASGTWTDTQVQESVNYRYRGTNTCGVVSSEPQLSWIQSVGPFAPTGLACVPELGALNLTWTNHSTTATAIQITRSPVAAAGTDVLATLAPTATAYRDGNLRPGHYTYSIRVSQGSRITLGGSVGGYPLDPPGAPVLQSTPLTTVPDLANAAVLTPSGTWIAGQSGYGFFSVFPPPGAAWNPWTITSAALVGNGFLAADVQGIPHMVHGSSKTAAALPAALVHAWFDGQGWSSEKITAYDGSGFGYFPLICIDPAGTPKVVASGGTGSMNWASLRYFTREGGTWTSESIGASLAGVSGWDAPMFGLDPAGRPHVMLPQYDSLLEMVRSNDGTWTSLAVTDANFTSNLSSGKCLWLDPDNAWFIFESVTYGAPGYLQLRAKAKVAGVWQPSVLVDAFDSFETFDAAITPDGSRLAIAATSERGPLVYVRTPQGWTGGSLPSTAAYRSLLRTGFDSGGRLHILLQSSPAVDWHEQTP